MKASKLLIPLISITAAAATQLWSANSTVGTTVNTTSGKIAGHANKRYPYVSEYLGIPFAQPPVGDLRFMPPKPYSSNQSVLIAAKQPPSCPQARAQANYSQPPDFVDYTLNYGTYANNTNEDCLFLNVWTKFPFPGAELKPVLVWIYGGGFHAGGASNAAQSGAIIAEQQDVVTVSFNYRLGIFGFPGAPNTRQNLGLLDQRLALEWVRDNVESFGGDPERIVIYGHSKGGQSIDYYNFIWTEDPIISGSIPMSGSAFGPGSNLPNVSALVWDTTAQLVGCKNSTRSSRAAILACMRTIDPAQLIDVVPAVEQSVAPYVGLQIAGYEQAAGPYGPSVDNITIFSNYTLLAQQRKFIQRPILTGTNDDEGCLFAERGAIPVSDEDEFTTYLFTCPSYDSVQARLNAGVPAWKYRFFGAYPNTYANACPGRGWHGLEDYVLFGSTREASEINATHQENDMGWWMRQAYAAFAHDPQSGLSNAIGWPRLSLDQSDVMVLGLNSTLATLQKAAVWNAPCMR